MAAYAANFISQVFRHLTRPTHRSGLRICNLILNVFANDSDPDNDLDLCSLSIVQEAQYGDVISDSNCGMLRYIPHVNYNGLDSFTYSVCDEQGACDQAKVSIEIRNVADAPIRITSYNVCYTKLLRDY